MSDIEVDTIDSMSCTCRGIEPSLQTAYRQNRLLPSALLFGLRPGSFAGRPSHRFIPRLTQVVRYQILILLTMQHIHVDTFVTSLLELCRLHVAHLAF